MMPAAGGSVTPAKMMLSASPASIASSTGIVAEQGVSTAPLSITSISVTVVKFVGPATSST